MMIVLKVGISLILCIFIMCGLGCDQLVTRNELEAIKARGELRVITRNYATCYYEGPHGPMGFEYELARVFAEYLGVDLRLLVLEDDREMILTLLQGEADLIASRITVTDQLKKVLTFGPPYLEVQQQVVGRRGGPKPGKATELIDQAIWVCTGSSHEEVLAEIRQQHPTLSWMAISGYDSEDLLELVWKGIIPLTVTDSHTFSVNRGYYPDLLAHFTFEKGQKVAWALHPHALKLQAAVYRWFNLPSTKLLLKKLRQHYFEHLDAFDYVDLKAFHDRLRLRLPKYRKDLEEAGEQYGLDWRLLAAQAYQESHWNPKARSFTGVRGLMMLTLETAKDYGVRSRLNPKEVISAGARHLSRLHGRIGSEVPEPDRTFMALAAYNVGWGHLEDARTLAARLGRDPNSWHGVGLTLPLLRQKRYYRTLAHGYARGKEPVLYVDHIRTYYRVLAQHLEKSEQNPGASERGQETTIP